MKKLLSLLFSLFSAYAIASYFFGSTVEDTFKDQVAAMQKSQQYKVELVSYDRGWLTSKAKAKLSYAFPPKPSTDPQSPEPTPVEMVLNFDIDLYHGPFLFKVDGLGFGAFDAITLTTVEGDVFSGEIEAKLSGILADKVTTRSRAFLDQSVISYVALEAFTHEEKGEKINVKPANAVVEFELNKTVKSSAKWDGMEFSDDKGRTFSLNALTIDADQTLEKGDMFTASAIFSGETNVSLGSLNVAGDDDEFQIEKVSVNANVSVDDSNMNVDSETKVAKVSVAGKVFTDSLFQLSLKQLDIESIQQFSEFMTKFQSAAEQEQAVLAQQFQMMIPQLLAKGPVIEIKQLSTVTTHGETKHKALISVDQSKVDVNNPMSLIMAIQADADGNVPEAFIAEYGLTPMVDGFVAQKLLVRDNDQLTYVFKFVDGQATANGVPIPLF